MDTERLKDKNVVITGAAQGMGAAIAEHYAAQGARICVTDVNIDGCNDVVGRIRDKGGEAIAVEVDVTDRATVKAAVAAAVEAFGSINVMLNNAGINKPLMFLDITEDNWHRIMDVNALGVLIGMQEAAKQMIAQGSGGKIINTASIAGRQGYAEFAPYCVSKAGVISLTQAGAREMAPHKITVNGIAPGVVVTPLWDGLEQDMIDKGVIKKKGEFIESFSASILLGFPSKPVDLAGITAFLASSDSDYITGQIIMCDGGMILV